MKKLLFMSLIVVSFSVGAKGKNCEENAENMAMIRDCVLTESNAPVNKALKELLKALSGNKEAIDALNKSQESWKAFRADTCDYLGVVYNGNGYADDERMNCAIDFNTSRVKILKKYLKDVEMAKK